MTSYESVSTPSPSARCGLPLTVGCFGMFFVCFCMLCFFLPCGGSGLIVALFASNGVSDTGSQIFRLEETGSIEIPQGNIKVNIVGQNSNELQIDHKLTVYGWSEGAARSALASYEIKVERLPGDHFIISVDEGNSGFTFYDLSLTISAPLEMQDIIIKSTGDVAIENVKGNFVIQTQSSNINLRGVNGQFDLSTTNFGAIDFIGNFEPASQNHFLNDWGDISVRIRGQANLSYEMRSTRSSSSSNSNRSITPQLTCPDTVQNLFCSGRLGDATAQLSLNSKGGDVALYAN